MAISSSPVQQATGSSPGSATTERTASLAPDAGDLIVVCCQDRDDYGVSGVSGSVNGAYTRAGAEVATGGAARVSIWYFANSGAGSETITVTYGGSTRGWFNASRWSGAATSSVLEDEGGNTNASGTTHNAANITFTGPGLIVVAATLGAYDEETDSDGFTELTQGVGGYDYCAYKLSSGETTDATFTTTGSVISAVKIASFKEAAGGVESTIYPGRSLLVSTSDVGGYYL